ncbi:DUF7266 family protein [Salinirarus marinus]|uniref:DUF7266 family protein n=1 Tax=Salinirarus marinus TaxID=3068310 RepID=UPI003C6BD8CC
MSAVRGERATSVTVSYVITLGISVVLISGLVMAGGNVLEDQRDGASRTGLRVAGQQLASDVATVDRLVTAGTDVDVSLVSDLPARIAGEAYIVEIRAHPTLPEVAVLTLTAAESEVVVEVTVRHRTPIRLPTRVSGGRLRIEYDADAAPAEVVVRGA